MQPYVSQNVIDTKSLLNVLFIRWLSCCLVTAPIQSLYPPLPLKCLHLPMRSQYKFKITELTRYVRSLKKKLCSLTKKTYPLWLAADILLYQYADNLIIGTNHSGNIYNTCRWTFGVHSSTFNSRGEWENIFDCIMPVHATIDAYTNGCYNVTGNS